MDTRSVKNVFIAIVIVVLFCISIVGGIYLSQVWHEPLNTNGEDSISKDISRNTEVDDEKNIYLKIVSDLEDKDYESAYKKLVDLKEHNPNWEDIENSKELYYYTRAKLYLKEGNRLSAEEIIRKVKDDYNGDFSKEIKELKLDFKKDKKEITINAKEATIGDGVKALESQRLLVSKKENIYVKMNNQIATIRDKQSREKIAYDEGFLSAEGYFTNKAQNEVDIQKIRLNAINEEIEAIKGTDFISQEEQNIEINTAMSRKSRIEQELQKAYTGQKEVARAIGVFHY